MKITIHGIGTNVGDRLESKISDKLNKFDKYFDDDASMNVKVRHEREVQIVEITLKVKNHIYRAEAKDEDVLSAVDRTVDKLESQIRRQKTRLSNRHVEYAYMKQYLAEEARDLEEEEDDVKSIIKRKSFTLYPITEDEAVLQMEMLGHNFLVFLDAETGNVSVVYKRKDENYGLIEPIY